MNKSIELNPVKLGNTENGNLAVLNNGIEFAATYFIMLLVLFFIGDGRYVSAGYWIVKKFTCHA